MIDRESESVPQPHPAAGQITDEALRVAASWLAERVHEAEVRSRGERAAAPRDWLEERYLAMLRQVRARNPGRAAKLGFYQHVTIEEHFRVIIESGNVYGHRGDEARPSFIWPEAERARLAAKWS